jgi:ABC-type multidrug transport system fused ATPase/permease subunit
MSLKARARSAAQDFAVAFGPAWRRAPWVLLMMLISVGLELTAVLLAAPFVSLLITPNNTGFVLPSWLVSLGLPVKLTLESLGGLVAIVFVIKAIASTRLQFTIASFSENRRAELMQVLLHAYQRKPYEYHLAHNSAELVNRVIWETLYVSQGALSMFMRIVVECIVAFVLVSVLAFSDWRALLLLLACLITVFILVLKAVRKAIADTVSLGQSSQAQVISTVQQSLGAYREVRLLGCENVFQEQLELSAKNQAIANARNSGLSVVPRQAIETTVVCFLVLLVYLRAYGGAGTDGVLITLGTFAVAAIRLMPASTALLTAITSIRASRPIVGKLANELRELSRLAPDNERQNSIRRSFESIELKSVSYRYPNQTKPALRDVDLIIKKGQLVGIMGRSGAGKSTLADVLLGFLRPQDGTILVNGQPSQAGYEGLQEFAAYIPQTVYLLDDTIRRNVAFGEHESLVDDKRVSRALDQAQLTEFVASLPQGSHTHVGERGVRMSGGQRQRVAIARAIYHRREVIVLDEATSALDAQTEQDVVSALNHMHGHQTLIVIAHKASVLSVADRIVRVVDGRLQIEEQHSLSQSPDAVVAENLEQRAHAPSSQ